MRGVRSDGGLLSKGLRLVMTPDIFALSIQFILEEEAEFLGNAH
jgi:hypothetical protein